LPEMLVFGPLNNNPIPEISTFTLPSIKVNSCQSHIQRSTCYAPKRHNTSSKLHSPSS